MIINKIPKSLRKFFPISVKRFFVYLYIKWLMRKGPMGFEKPRINFAGVLPAEGRFIRGGKVKLKYLRKRWGEYKDNFNIIYLVSSALPAYPDLWVKEAKRQGIKVFWNQNGIGVKAWAPDTWQRINQEMSSLKFADYVAYQSNFAKGEADDLVAKATGPWSIIVNSCEVDIFKPAIPHQPLKPFRIMVLGTAMTPEKIMIPLQALKILTDKGFDAELRSYGPAEWPNAEEEINEKIKEWKLEERVRRRGKYLQHESPDLYREGHVFIHTKHMDSSPNVLPEAMASGLPVITGSTGGSAEWTTPTAGITIEIPVSRERFYYPSPEAVASAIEEISKDWLKWSMGARENAVSNFSTEKFIESHAEAFKKIGIQNV